MRHPIHPIFIGQLTLNPIAFKAIGDTCATTKPAMLFTETASDCPFARIEYGSISAGMSQAIMLAQIVSQSPQPVQPRKL